MAVTLVTGATGFIGRHLVEKLVREGIAVRAFSRSDAKDQPFGPGVAVVYGDVRDPQPIRLALKDVETVFHLAGKVHDLDGIGESAEHEDVTVGGTRNLLAALGECGVKRLVFVSSLAVFGKGSSEGPSEAVTPENGSAYGRAKLRAERMVLDYGDKTGIHVSCLRPATVYGPGCKGNLPRMLRLIDRGLFPPLPDSGGRRSMVHVSDVVAASLLAASHPAANGQCYVVTDGRSYSARELYETISHGFGKRVPRWSVPLGLLKAAARAGDVLGRVRGKRALFDSDALDKLTGDAWYSSEKIAKELGFRPRVTFEDALPELIAWYRSTAVPPVC